MDELWEDAVNRFHLLTGEKLPTGRSVSFDDLKQRILERSRGADEANNPARNKANDTILTTLKYVQILGGVVAQAASAVSSIQSDVVRVNGNHHDSCKRCSLSDTGIRHTF